MTDADEIPRRATSARAKAEQLADWMYDHYDSKWEALAVHFEGTLDVHAAERTAALRAALALRGKLLHAAQLALRKLALRSYQWGNTATALTALAKKVADEIEALLADPEGHAATYESERQKLVEQVGECCRGTDPLCATGCLVEKALRSRLAAVERSRR